MKRFGVRATGLLVGCGLAAGCGPSGPVVCSVKGTVVYDGKPLPGGRIVFTNDAQTEEGVGDLTIDGAFDIARVPAGAVKAVVRNDHVKSMLSPQIAAMINKKGGAAVAPDPKVQGNKFVPIPGRYGDSASSGLSFTLKPNQMNEVTVELKK